MEIFGTIAGHYFSDCGMVLMEVNHVSPSNQNRFRVIGLTTVIALFGYLIPLMAANRVMRDHPDWVKKSGIRAKIPLPMSWHVKRLCILGASLLVIGVGFASSFKPQVQQTNLKDQQDNIQVNNVIDVPDIEVPTNDSQD